MRGGGLVEVRRIKPSTATLVDSLKLLLYIVLVAMTNPCKKRLHAQAKAILRNLQNLVELSSSINGVGLRGFALSSRDS